jgi:hypothetical protein
VRQVHRTGLQGPRCVNGSPLRPESCEPQDYDATQPPLSCTRSERLSGEETP